MSNPLFEFGIEIVESTTELETIILGDIAKWVEYPKLDNAFYFRLAKFSMFDKRFQVRYYDDNHAWVQIESGFVPCGWFTIGKMRPENE